MSEQDVYGLLLTALGSDRARANEAEQHLTGLKDSNFQNFVFFITRTLFNQQADVQARRLAGVILKNTLDAKDDEVRQQLTQRWLTLDPNFRNEIKNLVVQTFSSNTLARHQAAQVCAKIAVIEIPHQQWLDLIPGLTNNISASPDPFIVESSLECLGFLCEEIDLGIEQMAPQVDLILTAIVRGIKHPSQNQEIVYAGITALGNVLRYVGENFAKQNERTIIMTVVCETTQPPNKTEVRKTAFECLVKIAEYYYDYLQAYMQGIFNITLTAIRSEEPEVALQAIEFWSTVCDAEYEALIEIQDANAEGRKPECHCQEFVKRALQFLIPELLQALTKQDENADDDDWNISMAAGTCLSLIAITVLDEVVGQVMPFVQQHLNDENWRFREAATFAFGAILEGPESDTLQQWITSAMTHLLAHLKDSHPMVKDTTAWTIGRVCQFHPAFVQSFLSQLITALAESALDEPKVAQQACWALHNIALAYARDDTEEPEQTSELSQFFRALIELLLRVIAREDSIENNLNITAFETIRQLIRSAAADCFQIINDLVPYLLEMLAKTFSVQIVSQEDKEINIDRQALICGTLQVICEVLKKGMAMHAEKMVALFIELFKQSQSTSLTEDALMAIGHLAGALEMEFVRYLEPLMPFILAGLHNWEAYSVCSAAVGDVGDFCRAVNKHMTPYCDAIVTALLQNLQNPRFHRSVKPTILACFGDIALAIGGFFEKYLGVVVSILQQASATKVRDVEDGDEIEFVNSLREKIFETYTGIIQGLQMDKKATLFLPFVEQVILFIEEVWADDKKNEAIVQNIIGVLGDMAQVLGDQVKVIYTKPTIKAVIQECKEHRNPSIKEVGVWTAKLVQKMG